MWVFFLVYWGLDQQPMECVSSNCLCGLAQVMPQNWNVVTYNIVLQRDKCGLENVLPKHSSKAFVFFHLEEQTTFTEPLSQFPGCRRGSTHVRALLPHPAPIKQISSSLQGQGRWPIAPGGYPGTGVRAAFQKKWVIGELWRQTRNLQTWARFGGEPPNWWALYTSVAWWAANSCQTRLVGTGLKKARKWSSGEFCHEERCHEVRT